MGFEAGAASGSSGMYRTYPGHKFTNEASYNPKCVVAGSRHALVCYPHPSFVVSRSVVVVIVIVVWRGVRACALVPGCDLGMCRQ